MAAHLSNPIDESVVDWVKFFHGDVALVFSSLIRSMIQASPGKELFAADFSKIEVAVLWWMSGNEPGLKVLAAGRDPYIYQASANLGKSYEEISDAVKADETWAKDARQLAKAQVLGCGFGMGWSKFQLTAHDVYRLKLGDKQSREAVASYREANAAVPELWKAYEQAALNAVETPGCVFRAGRCRFNYRDGFLWVQLPSGRPLAYAAPQVSWRMRDFEVVETTIDDDGKEIRTTRTETRGPFKTLEFYAVNSKTKKWGLERTWGGSLTENFVQACARDLMASALLRLEKSGYQVLFQVHDEIVCEKEIGQGNLTDFIKIMCLKPRWALGLPVEADGWTGPRYKK